MKLDCQITDAIQRDFNSLWKCKQLGETLEISTPYLLPDSTLMSVFLTQRGDRYIVCDGGGVMELLEEYCALPADEMKDALDGIAAKFRMKEDATDGKPLFFKDCTDLKLISSLVFDVANFATMASSALVTVASDKQEEERTNRFATRAEAFLRTVKPANLDFRPQELPEVPGVRFSAVLASSNKVWIVSYVTGSNATYFRRSVCDTAMSFKHAWQSSLQDHIGRTIPLVNTDADGYQPQKLQWQLDELHEESRNSTVKWFDKDDLAEMLRS
jgi:hypothetical protein